MIQFIKKIKKVDYRIEEAIEEFTSNDSFFLHDHDSYEILFFLEGDSKFIIEGKEYFLESGDVIIVRKHAPYIPQQQCKISSYDSYGKPRIFHQS